MTEAIAERTRLEREDFAARVRGEHADDIAFRQYVLSELRLAYRRAKLHMQAIGEAAKMVETKVDPEVALGSIGDAMEYVIPTPPVDKLFRYVPWGRMDDYLAVGWMPAECRPHPHMDQYRAILCWPCDCPVVEPTPRDRPEKPAGEFKGFGAV